MDATFEYDLAEPEDENIDGTVSSLQSIEPKDDGTERACDGGNVVDNVMSPKEDESLTRSGKKRRKRKSQTLVS